MEVNAIIYGALSLGILGLIMGGVLIFAHNKIAVAPDETVVKIEEALPNANCGACGFPGCSGYAEAIVHQKAALNLCTPGGEATTEKIAQIIGAEMPDLVKKVAFIHCQGHSDNVNFKYEYNGILECSQAEGLFKGAKACDHACLGLGSCFRACPFEAISVNENMLVEVDPEKCTGCGLCTSVCPRDIISLVPYRERPVVYRVACKSTELGKDTRQQCKTGCIGCGLCVKKCPVNAIELENNLATINMDKCVGCSACEKACPTKAITHLKQEPKAVKQDSIPKKEKDHCSID